MRQHLQNNIIHFKTFNIMSQNKTNIENEVQEVQEVQEEREERETVVIKGTILRVSKGRENRYFFELDCEPFRSYNEKDEEVLTTTFGKDITSFAKEVGIQHEVLNAGFALSSAIPNATLSSAFVSLCLIGSEVEAKRTLRHAEDQRQGMTASDIYGKEVWTSEIITCVPHLTNLSTQLLLNYLQDINKLVVKQNEDEEKNKKPDYKDLLASIQ